MFKSTMRNRIMRNRIMRSERGARKSGRAFFVLAAALALAAALGAGACASLKDVIRSPEISFVSCRIAGISFDGVQLLAKIRVNNPNPLAIPLPQMNWDFFLSGNPFLRGSIPEGNALSAHKSVDIDLPLSFTYAGVFQGLRSLAGADETEYRIALETEFNIPVLGTRRFGIEHSGKIPLLSIPAVRVKGIRLANPSRSTLTNPVTLANFARTGRLDFQITWEIENRNAIAVNLQQFNYDLRVNNVAWGQGTIPSSPRIAARGRTEIPLTVSLNGANLITSLARIIGEGQGLSYTCTGSAALSGELSGVTAPGITLPLNLSGTVIPD